MQRRGIPQSALGYGGITGFDLGSFFIAVLGSILLLVVYRALRR